MTNDQKNTSVVNIFSLSFSPFFLTVQLKSVAWHFDTFPSKYFHNGIRDTRSFACEAACSRIRKKREKRRKLYRLSTVSHHFFYKPRLITPMKIVNFVGVLCIIQNLPVIQKCCFLIFWAKKSPKTLFSFILELVKELLDRQLTFN